MDLDADGDLDAVLFHGYSTDSFPYNTPGVSVWENTGSKSAAAFTQVVDYTGYGYGTGDNITVNPFTGDFQNSYGHPVSAADYDNDGDLDFFGGQQECGSSGNDMEFARSLSDGYGVISQAVQYGSNEGSIVGASYGNPFYGTQFMPITDPTCSSAYAGAVAAGDLDNDTDIDIISYDSNILKLFMNDGTNGYGHYTFNQVSGADTALDGINGTSGNYGAPLVLHDVDGDGDKDLVIGTRSASQLRLLRNIGSASTADFQEVTNSSGIDVTSTGWAAPTFADMDDDGDDDLIVVTLDGNDSSTMAIRYFKNTPDTKKSSSGGGGSIGIFATLLLGLTAWRKRRQR